jgi:hypothetical protein
MSRQFLPSMWRFESHRALQGSFFSAWSRSMRERSGRELTNRTFSLAMDIGMYTLLNNDPSPFHSSKIIFFQFR